MIEDSKDNSDPNFFHDKDFDLYNHMKCNIKCTVRICEIHDSELNIYCFGCKRSICEVCKETFHSEHNVILKDQIKSNNEILSILFNNLEQNIKKTQAFSNPEILVNSIKKMINSEFDEMEKKLNELREKRLKEVNKTFSTNNEDAVNLKKNIDTTKQILTNFMNKNKNFFFGQGVYDDDNFLFLQIYDIFNSVYEKSLEYNNLISLIHEYYSFNDLKQSGKFKHILESINKSIDELTLNETKTEKIINEVEDEEIGLNHKRRKSLFEQIEDISKEKDKKNKSTNKMNIKDPLSVKTMIKKHQYILKNNSFNFLQDKIKQIEDFMVTFKKSVYDSFVKHSSLVEVEKLVRMYEEKAVKRINYLQQSQVFSNSKTKASIRGSKAGLTRSKVTLQTINNKDNKDSKDKENNTESSVNKTNKDEKSKKNQKDVDKAKKDSKNINSPNKKAVNLKAEMFSLQEIDDEYEDENNYKEQKLETESDSDSSLFGGSEDNNIKVNIDKNVKNSDKEMLRLNNMFKPKPKLDFSKLRIENIKEIKDIHQTEEEKFKVNANLLELIKENQRLTNLIKKQEDITLAITTIRRYYSFSVIEYIKLNDEAFGSNAMSSNIFESSYVKETFKEEVKIIEGTNKLIIYDREKSTIRKIKVEFDKSKLKCTCFLPGCRIFKNQDKVFISGGRDISGDKKLFLIYNIKENKLIRLQDMTFPRSYHSITFHESLKSLVVIGGENCNKCEMYDFYLNMWNTIPELNIPRADANIFIDKVGTFAYVLSGINGSITSNNYSDCLEFLDLVDMNQGWIRVELKNKPNVDLKNKLKICPISDTKLLIYGAKESRNLGKCFVMLDLKNLELIKLQDNELELIRTKKLEMQENTLLLNLTK